MAVRICPISSASTDNIALKGFAADQRIGDSHLNVPGPDGKLGFGGSCFPKDINAFMSFAKSVGIKTGGQDYTSPPTIIGVGQPNMSFKNVLVGGSVEKVSIVTNDSGFDDNLQVIPTVNSNGVGVINAVSQVVTGSQTNTLFLRAPIVGFPTGGFPFAIGDEIFVENVKILENDDQFTGGGGYNSSDYGFENFVVSGINTITAVVGQNRHGYTTGIKYVYNCNVYNTQ